MGAIVRLDQDKRKKAKELFALATLFHSCPYRIEILLKTK